MMDKQTQAQLVGSPLTGHIYPNYIENSFYKDWLKTEAWDKQEAFMLVFYNHHPVLDKLICKFGLFQDYCSEFEAHEEIYKQDISAVSPIKLTEVAFQYLPDFDSQLADAYKEICGQELAYLDYSPIVKFYKKWSKYPLWTQDQAICLINNMSPETKKCRISGEREAINPRFPFHTKLYQETESLVDSCRLAGTLEKDQWDGESYTYKPTVFLSWAQKNGFQPHPLLLKFIKTDTLFTNIQIAEGNSKEMKSSSLILSAVSQQQCSFKLAHFAGPSELHKLIEQFYRKNMYESKQFPNATTIRNLLQKQPKIDDFSIITKMTKDQIEWISSHDYPQTMKTKTFDSFISQLKKNYEKQLITHIFPA